MSTALYVQDLTRRFGSFTAVNRLSFSVPEGEIFGFLGPNGSGKSTTIRMLCGILEPSEGTGQVAGFDIISSREEIRGRIGYMSQKFILYEELSVNENLRFFGAVYGLAGKRLEKNMDFARNLTELNNVRDVPVRNFPAGIKQRLSLAAAILHDPPILFLDEPTSGVDPIRRRDFWELIYKLSRHGKTVFVTTHYMDEAEHCDRVAMLVNGSMAACDRPDNLRKAFPYTVWTIRTPDTMAAFAAVQKAEFAVEISLFGTDVHVLVPNEYDAEPFLRTCLSGKQFADRKISRIEPSLEDVFVQLSSSAHKP